MMSQRITEITITPVPAYYPHDIAGNAYNENLGTTRLEWLVRARTDGGIEALGNAKGGWHSVEELARVLDEALLGRRVDELLEVSTGRVAGPKKGMDRVFQKHRWMTILAYDLLARERGVSCVDLLGGRKRERVDAYDTTLYFQDISYPEKTAMEVAKESAAAFKAGWRQMKIKTGRGGRWMMPDAGMRRDVEVVQAVREAVGPGVKLMVDANFGYDGRLDLLEDFIRETLPSDVYWLEEMVRADVEAYRSIRRIQERLGSKALLVCGEVDTDYPMGRVYRKLAREGLIDGYQPDIVSQGFVRWKEIEGILDGTGVRGVPHCFGNGNFGTRASIIWGAVSESFISVEDERCAPNVYKKDGFTFENGAYAVADAPGLGLEVDEEEYRRRYAANEVKISGRR